MPMVIARSAAAKIVVSRAGHRLRGRTDARALAPEPVEPRADGLCGGDLGGGRDAGGRRRDPRRGPGGGGELDEQHRVAAGEPLGDEPVVQVLGRGPRVEGHRSRLQGVRTQPLDERSRGEDEGVARFDLLAPDRRQQVRLGAERRCLACGGAVHEVRELAGLDPRQEQPGMTDEEHLARADPCGVGLAPHHHGARAVQERCSTHLLEPLGRTAIGVPQRLAQRHLDPGGEVVVVLIPRQLRELARERHRARTAGGCLAQDVEASFGPERRPDLGLVHEDDVGSLPDVGRAAHLRREAGLLQCCESSFASALRTEAPPLASMLRSLASRQRCGRKLRGSMGSLPRRTAKCRCDPVVSPVIPIAPRASPGSTRSPTRTVGRSEASSRWP